MNSNIINSGVDAVNKSRLANVESRAQTLITQIESNRKGIESYEPHIKAEQEALSKLGLNTLTAKGMFGEEPSGELTVNQVTILKVIAKINESRQSQVELSSQSHINKIESYRKTQESLQVQINEWQKQLRELSVDVVTVEKVLA